MTPPPGAPPNREVSPCRASARSCITTSSTFTSTSPLRRQATAAALPDFFTGVLGFHRRDVEHAVRRALHPQTHSTSPGLSVHDAALCLALRPRLPRRGHHPRRSGSTVTRSRDIEACPHRPRSAPPSTSCTDLPPSSPSSAAKPTMVRTASDLAGRHHTKPRRDDRSSTAATRETCPCSATKGPQATAWAKLPENSNHCRKASDLVAPLPAAPLCRL